MTISATLTASLKANQRGPNAFADEFDPNLSRIQALAGGVAAGQADLMYAAERSVATASNDDIDLSGSLTDAFGVTITMAEMVGIIIVNEAKNGTANTTDLTIGAGSNPFIGFLGATDTIGPIKPGGSFMLFAGDAAGIGAVTAGTGDILRIANSAGATATYQIAILGRTA